MVRRAERLGIDEVVGQLRRVAFEAPEQQAGVVVHRLRPARAVRHQHVARVGIAEHGLDAGGDVARQQRDRAGRRHRGEQRIAHPRDGDRGLHVVVEALDRRALGIARGVVEREGALLPGKLGGREVCRPLQAAHPLLDQGVRRVAAVARPAHDERVGEPGDAEPDAPLRLRLLLLRRDGEARAVDRVVEHPDGGRGERLQRRHVERRARLEGILHQTRQIDRAQEARAVGRQRLLAAGICGEDLLAVGEVVGPVDAVDEDHAGLGVGVGRADDPLPQRARRDGPVDDALEAELPWRVVLDRLHERIGHQHREVEHAEPAGLALGLDEGLDVGMIAAQAAHHGAAPKTRAHDGAAHRVPAVHERQRPRGVGADALDRRSLGPERGEVVADAAALLHGERGLLQVLEDRGHVVRDPAHHEAVEERDLPLRPCAGEDAAGGQELEPFQRAVELRLPARRLRLDRGQGAGDPPPAVLDGAVDGRAVGRLQAVLHVPYAGRDRQHLGHGRSGAPSCAAIGSISDDVRILFPARTLYQRNSPHTI